MLELSDSSAILMIREREGVKRVYDDFSSFSFLFISYTGSHDTISSYFKVGTRFQISGSHQQKKIPYKPESEEDQSKTTDEIDETEEDRRDEALPKG
jgi:hypothetical protein